ncbi:preprotein translocase subunit SecE [Aureibacillus halotolerans]|uniref:Protein translocase subunit SecE n=1 Tax=Aureibacillus halotolerans TaxID=1508390 RepID=A0A4R6TV39_9BACI|nr:preprotein translocase subunit SecE [Aureibacillus halotolerans]TDQ34694.1 protein translocase subunit secE/sec61 gamma [Aureibacillus halotolerans]
MGKITSFLRDVVKEMKKVSWPKKKELFRYTVTVLATVAFMTVFFAVADYGISAVIDLIIGE